MSRTRQTKHDKQIEVWSQAVKVAVEYVQSQADVGDENAKRCLMAVMAILYEDEVEEEGSAE